MRYKVVVCPHCGRIQATTATRRFRCRFCGRTHSAARLRVLAATDNPRELPRLVGSASVRWRAGVR